ncbi:MAG: hypothetical protein GAK41_01196 [Burkholderia gladioli]|nr:MAG: hypothetical protein GAK41_01196 [Burkholderia gladioli]
MSWERDDEAVTDAGYPYEVRRWTRGTALEDAPVVFRGERDDISAGAGFDPVGQRHTAWRSVDFFDVHTYRLGAGGQWLRYDVPAHVVVGFWHGWLVLEPRLDWACEGALHAGGSLLAIREDAFLAGSRTFATLFAPGPSTSACTWTHTHTTLIASWLDDVRNRTQLWQPAQDAAGEWQWTSRAFDWPKEAEIDIEPVESTLNDEIFVDVDTFLDPPECWLADLADRAADAASRRVLLDRPPVQFDASELVVRRAVARSRDGTEVPYTLIGPRDALDGATVLAVGLRRFRDSIPNLPACRPTATRSASPGSNAAAWRRGGVRAHPAAAANSVRAGIPTRSASIASVRSTISARWPSIWPPAA